MSKRKIEIDIEEAAILVAALDAYDDRTESEEWRDTQRDLATKVGQVWRALYAEEQARELVAKRVRETRVLVGGES